MVLLPPPESTKNGESTFFDDAIQLYFSCFCPIKHTINKLKLMHNMCFEDRFSKFDERNIKHWSQPGK
jgi:hypothetical protein